jgi:ubiquinone/menaquinone biosynthesis C-methylase UbiE
MSHVRPMTEVASAYDQWARTYEAVENATRDLAATVLRHYPLHMHNRDVLETGCGTGLNTTYLAQQSRSRPGRRWLGRDAGAGPRQHRSTPGAVGAV